jgi:hypothetical protein
LILRVLFEAPITLWNWIEGCDGLLKLQIVQVKFGSPPATPISLAAANLLLPLLPASAHFDVAPASAAAIIVYRATRFRLLPLFSPSHTIVLSFSFLKSAGVRSGQPKVEVVIA